MKIHDKSIRIRNYNFILIGSVLCLLAIGLFAIHQANQAYVTKQFIGSISGIIRMVVASSIDYR